MIYQFLLPLNVVFNGPEVRHEFWLHDLQKMLTPQSLQSDQSIGVLVMFDNHLTMCNECFIHFSVEKQSKLYRMWKHTKTTATYKTSISALNLSKSSVISVPTGKCESTSLRSSSKRFSGILLPFISKAFEADLRRLNYKKKIFSMNDPRNSTKIVYVLKTSYFDNRTITRLNT